MASDYGPDLSSTQQPPNSEQGLANMHPADKGDLVVQADLVVHNLWIRAPDRENTMLSSVSPFSIRQR
jgi:hypothetical protein